MAGPIPKIIVTDVTNTLHDGDADDEYYDSQHNISPQSTSTFTQQQITVSEETKAAQGSSQVTGQITGQVTEQVYTSKAAATKPIGDITGQQPTSQRIKVSQATGTITGQLPTAQDAKQVKIAGQVTEVTATQGFTGPGPETGPSTLRSTRSIRKAISAVLDGSPFRSSPSNRETKYPEELNNSPHSTPQPKPRLQTAADPPRPPMDGHEWVWFPAGYWAEREVITRPTKTIRPPKWVRRSLQGSAGSTYGSPLASAPRSLNPSEVWAKHPDDVDDDEERDADGPRRRRASTPPGEISPGRPDRETPAPRNLLQKLQQISHSRKASASGASARKGRAEESRPESPPIDLERSTTNTLRGTSQYFSKFLAMKKQNERAMHPLSPDEQSLKLPRKRFGLAPWHQNSSGDTIRTATSSLRELLFGRTPPSTPQSGSILADARPNEYFGVEVPGSRTAPLSKQNVQQGSTPRSPDQGTIKRRRQPAVDIPGPSEPGNYATELTEHFSGSPLCPLHPKYKSPGKGYCPYHSLSS